MENLTLHHLWQNMNDLGMRQQHEAIRNERARRFQTWPVARLLQIIYETPDYRERSSYLIQLCDVRIEPIMTGRSNDPTMMFDARQDLLDLLAFREWYANNDDIAKIEPIDAVLKRYPVQALQNQINAINRPYDLAFMQATHPRLGAGAEVNEFSPEPLRDIISYSHL